VVSMVETYRQTPDWVNGKGKGRTLGGACLRRASGVVRSRRAGQRGRRCGRSGGVGTGPVQLMIRMTASSRSSVLSWW